MTLLPGCNFDDPDHPDLADDFLRLMSGWNNEVQAALFNPNTLAPTFKASQITRPPRFNAFYDISQAPQVDPRPGGSNCPGRSATSSAWRIDQLRALPQESQITRFICVEGWRVIGQWSGVPLRHFLRAVSADTRARYVSFHCADGYFTSIDMESALHPADHPRARLPGRTADGTLRRSGPAADPDQARIQESKIHRGDGSHQPMDRRILGKTRLQLVQWIMKMRILAGVALFGLMSGTAFAALRPVVVELFTSQGCSDCPPADALLRHVKATDPDVLALDLHVTYWDNAAWKDPFSLQGATDLQN